MKITRSQVMLLARWILGGSLGAVTLAVALQSVSLPDIAQTFANANWFMVGLALLSVAVNTSAKAVRWKLILGQRGSLVSFGKYCAVLLAGQTLNTIFPARIGDLARAYLLGGMGIGRSYVLGTLVFEKLVDTLCYALLFFVLLAIAPLPTWLSSSAYAFIAITLAFSLGVMGAYAGGGRLWQFTANLLRRLPGWVHVRLVSRLQAALEGITSLRSWRALAGLVLGSVVIWGTAILNNHLVLWALGLMLPVRASVLILVVLQAGISFPGVPGKVGLFELACILALAVFGVTGSTAFGYGVLLHAVVLLPSTFVGLWFVWSLGWARGSELVPR